MKGDKKIGTIMVVPELSPEEKREASLVLSGISIKLADPVGLGIVLAALDLK